MLQEFIINGLELIKEIVNSTVLTGGFSNYNYKQKYLKYKQKYLNFKNMLK